MQMLLVCSGLPSTAHGESRAQAQLISIRAAMPMALRPWTKYRHQGALQLLLPCADASLLPRQGAKLEEDWNSKVAEYEKKYPEEAAEFKQLTSGELPDGWDAVLPTFSPEDKVQLAPSPAAHCGLPYVWTQPLTFAPGDTNRHHDSIMGAGAGDARPLADDAECAAAGAAGSHRRLRRPGALQPDHHEGAHLCKSCTSTMPALT